MIGSTVEELLIQAAHQTFETGVVIQGGTTTALKARRHCAPPNARVRRPEARQGNPL